MAAKRLPRIASACWDDLPQIAQNSQNLLLGNILPQIAQIYTDGLGAKDPPTDFTEFTEPANFRGCTCLKCTNQPNSGPPTDCTDLHRWLGCGRSSHRLHRIQIYTDGLSAEDSSGGILASATAKCLPQIAQIYTEAANFRGCTCLKCTNIARGAPT